MPKLEWMNRARPPRWWQELALLLIAYWLYSLVRNAIHTDPTSALRHGRAVQHLQQNLGFGFERPLNHWVADHEAVAQFSNYYYATLHFAVTLGVLVWLFRTRPDVYRSVRTILFGTTLLALVGFYLYPLAPPRLLPQYGYVDTLVRFQTWGSLADPQIADRSNQYAAMPSLHVAWALWAGLALLLFARRRWIRTLGLCYPLATTVVVLGTANHFLVDAIAGAAVLMLATAVQLASTTGPTRKRKTTTVYADGSGS
ncbi:MAG: hypothetical protein JWM76_593 [Pseudonocardiales bacterium]|nr:hypothetical protein [Pseudonocardiales bacterium]